MAVAAYVGLVVCAHNNGALSTAVLDNVSASFVAANTAPVLNPISNQTVSAGQTVALTASAADTDSPPQTLTFNLVGGPVQAALTQINNTNAAFTWRPAVANASASYPVSLKVTDNGLPSLSATQNFTVTVNPLTLPALSLAAAGNGLLNLQISGPSGPDCAVQVSTNLNSANWLNVFNTNSPALPFNWTYTNQALIPAQFFRVLLGP